MIKMNSEQSEKSVKIISRDIKQEKLVKFRHDIMYLFIYLDIIT